MEPRLAWRAARRFTAALVIALFPALFLLDQHVGWPVSPVLPGLAVLALLVVLLPFGVAEVIGRRARRTKDAQRLQARQHRLDVTTKVFLGLAWLWFMVWLVVIA